MASQPSLPCEADQESGQETMMATPVPQPIKKTPLKPSTITAGSRPRTGYSVNTGVTAQQKPLVPWIKNPRMNFTGQCTWIPPEE
jgi:hypothetical protein